MRIIALRYVEEKTMGQCTFGGVATGRKKKSFQPTSTLSPPFYTQHSSLHFSNFYAHPFFSHLRPNITTRFSPPKPLPVSHCALSQKIQFKHNTFPRLPFTFFFLLHVYPFPRTHAFRTMSRSLPCSFFLFFSHTAAPTLTKSRSAHTPASPGLGP